MDGLPGKAPVRALSPLRTPFAMDRLVKEQLLTDHAEHTCRTSSCSAASPLACAEHGAAPVSDDCQLRLED